MDAHLHDLNKLYGHDSDDWTADDYAVHVGHATNHTLVFGEGVIPFHDATAVPVDTGWHHHHSGVNNRGVTYHAYDLLPWNHE